jgi:trigger factor
LKVDYAEEGSALRHLDFELPAEDLNDEFEKGVVKLRKTVKLPGFRKGKIPKDVIRTRFHSDVLEQAVHDLLNKAVHDALEERELYPLGDPQISNLEPKLGEPLKFRASFEVMPDVEAKDYEGLEATEQKTEVTDEQIDNGIEHLREQNARFDPIEGRGAQDHDFVMGDLIETPSGGGAADRHEGVSFEVGSEAYHETLHEKLQGAEAGAAVNFSASFPAKHGDPKRAGKSFDVVFEVKELKQKVLPDADDEFAKDMGDYDTLDEVRAALRGQAEERAGHDDAQHLRGQLLEKLIAANTFDAPASLVEHELDGRVEAAARDLYQRGIDPRQAGLDWAKVREEQRPSAENAVKATLVLDSIVKQEKLEETEEELSEEVEKASKVLEKSVEATRAQMMKDGTLERVRGRLRREKAVDFIKVHAKLK